MTRLFRRAVFTLMAPALLFVAGCQGENPNDNIADITPKGVPGTTPPAPPVNGAMTGAGASTGYPAPKGDEAKKDDMPKAEDEKKADDTKKDDAPKADETKKDDTSKSEAPKSL